MTTCTEVHVDSGYGYRPSVTTPCFREIDADGRHRGQHQGWQDMPAGQTTHPLTGEVETWAPWRRLWTWSQGGAMGTARGQEDVPREPCPLCGALVPPATDGGIRYPGAPDAYSVSEQNLGGACYDCRLWAGRIAFHAAGWQRQSRGLRRLERSVREHRPDGTTSDRLAIWSEGHTGAFADRACTVTWDDGDTRGPASSLWDAGAIPWWLDDQLPANATVTWGGR